MIFPLEAFPVNGGGKIIISLFVSIFFLQFGIPAYFGIRYLGRLPVSGVNKSHENNIERFEPESVVLNIDQDKDSESQDKYKDSLFPLGILGTFILIMGMGMIPAFFATVFWGAQAAGFIFLPCFLFIFFTPIIDNHRPSPFQRKRDVIAAFTGGGSVFLFSGSWPFFRLFVYQDGLEIRVMFHRFFVPYDEMGDIPEKLGFFNRGILIESNLPDVPSGIRFNCFGINNVIRIIRQNKTKLDYVAPNNRR